MSWLSSFLHPEKSYDKAQKELEKYYQEAQNGLQPYNQNGLDTYGKYSGAMDKLLNPSALQDEWSKNYQESDLAKQNEAMASQSGLNAAQQMGLNGSSPAIQAIQSGTSGIVAQDRQKYLDDLMQKYMTGIGVGSDIYGKGASAANSMSQNAMNMGQNSAQNKFNQSNAQGDLFGKLLGGGFGLAGSALGGPIGGALASGLAQKMGWSPKGSYNPSPTYGSK
jgi:hypothetical protein